MLASSKPPWLWPFGLAVSLVGVATAVTMLLAQLADHTIFALFYAAVVIAAWRGGLWAGLLATVLSALASAYFLLPLTFSFNLGLQGLIQVVDFGLVALLINWLVGVRRQDEAKADARARRAEEAQRLLQVLLEHVPEGITIAEGPPDFPITANSATAAQLLGRPPEDLVGLPAGQHIEAYGLFLADGETRPTPEQMPLYRATRFGEVIKNEEWVIVRPDGDRLTVLVDVNPIRAEDGRIIGAVNCWRDIPKQKQLVSERQATYSQLEAQQRHTQALHAEAMQVRERLERILEGINDHFVMYDQEWRYVYVNEKAAQTLGHSKEELIGHRIWDLFPDAVGNFFYLKMHQAVAERQNIAFEFYYEPFGKWFENRAYPITDGLLLFTADITERKRWEAEREQLLQHLEAEYERLEIILQQTPAGIIIAAAPSGKALLVNEHAKRLTGFDFETSAEIEWYHEIQNFQGFHPDGRLYQAEEWPLSRAVRQGERVVNEEIELQRSDGSRIIIQANAAPIYNAEGNIVAGVTAFVDITAQKRAVELIHFQASLLDQVQNAVMVDDLEGKIIYWNSYAERLYGWTAEEALGQTVFELLAPQIERQEFIAARTALARSSGKWESEFVVRRKDGTALPIFVTSSPIKNSAGQMIGFMGVSVDITQRKRVELVERLLAEAGKVLVTSLDPATQLSNIAALAVPDLADWCVIDTSPEPGIESHVVIAHADPAKVALAHEWRRRFPINWNASSGVAKVTQTGQSEIYPVVTEAMLQASINNAEYLQILRQLQISSVVIVPLIARGRTLGGMTFIWAESGNCYNEEDLALAEELAHRAALALDNARLYEAEQRARKAAEQVTQRIVSLQAITAKLAQALTPTEIIQIVFNDGLATIGADGSVFALLTDEQDELEIVNSIGYPAEVIAAWRRIPFKARIPMADVVQSGQPLFLSTRTALAAMYPDMATTIKSNNQAWAVLPLVGKSQAIGAVSIGFIEAKEFTPEEQEFILTVTHQCTQALERARLYEELEQHVLDRTAKLRAANQQLEREIAERQRMAVELAEIQHRLVESLDRERITLAQELHDGPVQELSGVLFGLSQLQSTLTDQSDKVLLIGMQKLIQGVIQMLRAMFTELRPPALGPYGLEKAIRSHAEKFQMSQLKLKIKLDLTPDGQELPEQTRLVLFRIYREAFNNIVRHAQAKQVWVRFNLDAEQVLLEIQDDGRGFEVPQRWVELARQGHLGLVGMIERAEAINGRLYLNSALGAGTLIQVVVPRSPERELA